MSVLICYDGSPSARNAILSAADALGPCEATLLHLWNPPIDVLPDSFGYTRDHSDVSTRELTSRSEQRAREIAEEGRQLAHDHGLTADPLVRPIAATAWETVLEVADERDSSIIIVGAHPRGRPGPSLSSVSAAILEHSSRPVLVIPMQTPHEDGAGSGTAVSQRV